MADPRNTRAWRTLRDRVVLEEPDCRLRLPGCTGASTTADHIKPYRTHPELVLERTNLRGACQPCNHLRSSVPDEALVLGGPDASAGRARALDIFKPLGS